MFLMGHCSASIEVFVLYEKSWKKYKDISEDLRDLLTRRCKEFREKIM